MVLEKVAKKNKSGTGNWQKQPYKRKGLWNFPFFPPGFRTGTIWKMLLGGLGYLFIFWIGLSMEVTKSDGSEVTGFYLWANRLIVWIWSLLTVAFYADYLGLRSYFPLMQRKYIRIIGYLLWPIIFLFALVFILVLIGA